MAGGLFAGLVWIFPPYFYDNPGLEASSVSYFNRFHIDPNDADYLTLLENALYLHWVVLFFVTATACVLFSSKVSLAQWKTVGIAAGLSCLHFALSFFLVLLYFFDHIDWLELCYFRPNGIGNWLILLALIWSGALYTICQQKQQQNEEQAALRRASNLNRQANG